MNKLNTVYVELYRRKFGPRPFRWRIRSIFNGQNMGNGSQGYADRRDLMNGAEEGLGLVWHADSGQHFRNGTPIRVVDNTQAPGRTTSR